MIMHLKTIFACVPTTSDLQIKTFEGNERGPSESEGLEVEGS